MITQTLVRDAANVPPPRAARQTFVGVETSSYSGATLLAFLLCAHPDITSIGEMNGVIASEEIETYHCSCGERIQQCDFWCAMQSAMARRGYLLDLAHFDTEFLAEHPGVLRRAYAGSFRNVTLDTWRDKFIETLPQEKSALQARAARNVAFVESVMQITGKAVLVDTSKDPLRVKLLQKYSALDVRAIHLVRDPRGVIASRMRRNANLDARRAAREWARLHERLEYTLAPLSAIIVVRYEDLCLDVYATLRDLFEFCGVANFPLRELQNAKQHIIGNPMRLKHANAIRLDESWRDTFSRAQLDEIWRIAGHTAQRYGYFHL